jgi:hypothetical protein
MKISTTALALAMTLVVPSVGAVNQEIRALFTPDPSQPQKNVFINKTPNSGYCATYPDQCRENNMFSIRLPFRFGPRANIGRLDLITVKVPANWRQLTVTNRQTLETETVEVRITGVGSEYVLSHSAASLVGVTDILDGHQKLWFGSSWVYAPTPCEYSGVGAYTPNNYRFFWKTPVEAACNKRTNFAIPHMSFETLDIAYELRTPNPLGMSSGLYTGSMNYRIGQGADFDIGGMPADDSNLTLDFVLDVLHTLKVDLPPGGEKIRLTPAGGWQSWLQEGRKPVRLFWDQSFHISASTRFKMHLECEIAMNPYECMILDRKTGRAVEVQVSTTLPNGLADLAGQPVKHRRLRAGASNAQQFQPGFYVDRRPGVLHFEIPPSQMGFMLSPGQAGYYAGNVTVIWDSDL